jgi:hypothetical protein
MFKGKKKKLKSLGVVTLIIGVVSIFEIVSSHVFTEVD